MQLCVFLSPGNAVRVLRQNDIVIDVFQQIWRSAHFLCSFCVKLEHLLVQTMDTFQKQFEDLDLQSGVMNDTMNRQAELTTPQGQVDTLLQQIADEHQMDLKVGIPTAGSKEVGVTLPAQKTDDLQARLDALRH